MSIKLFMNIKKITRIFGVVGIFVTGALFGSVLSQIDLDSNIPTGQIIKQTTNEFVDILNPLNFDSAVERASPSNWVKAYQIDVFSDRIVLDIKDAQWASFTNTNSMDPVLDETANAIQIKPESPDDLKVGDIVSYIHPENGRIIHRIAYKGQDENGIYFIMKGDNNPTSDPDKVLFEQITSVTIAIIY